MKIVQINTECNRGSTGKIAVSISKLLTEQGIENYIFYSGKNPSAYSAGIMINTRFQVRIHQILSRILGNQGFHSYFTTKRLIKRLEKINPDVIHLHNLHGYYLHMEILFKYLKKNQIPVIWTLHDCWAFTGHCTYFTMAKCEQWKSHCTHCTQKHIYPYSWFFDRSSKLFDKKRKLFTGLSNMTIVTPSEWLAGLVKESFLQDYPVKVINNGIDLEVFKPVISDFREKHGIGGGG